MIINTADNQTYWQTTTDYWEVFLVDNNYSYNIEEY